MTDREEPVPAKDDVLGTGASGQPAAAGEQAPQVPRNPFRRRRDYLVAVLSVLVIVSAGVLVWQTSDLRATTSRPGPEGVREPAEPKDVPARLTEAWRAPSAATPVPVVAGPSVVTGHGGTVTGRDPDNGKPRWSYSRDLPLCTVDSAWSQAISVYRKGSWCSEVTTLFADTGKRANQRNGDVRPGTRLLTDGSYLTATGKRLLNTWRDDLVLSMEYGTVPNQVNADKQPRTGCTFGSTAVAPGRVGVLERCGGDTGDRVTVYKATADDNEKPEEVFSVVAGKRGAQLVALTNERAAVLIPAERALVIFDDQGKRVATHPVDTSDPGMTHDPAGGVVPTSEGAAGITWYTGARTISLSPADLSPQWSVPGTLGPGTVVAGRVLLPVPGGLEVTDQVSGARLRTIPVDRQGYSGPVRLGSHGGVVLEQRGNTLVALTGP